MGDELLRVEIDNLKAVNSDISLMGFSEDEFAAILVDKTVGLTDPDETPEAPLSPISNLGDVWILGKHRITCGSSTDADVVQKLLGGVSPHLMVTDPPYGV